MHYQQGPRLLFTHPGRLHPSAAHAYSLRGRIFRAARFRIRKTVKKVGKKGANHRLAASPAPQPRKSVSAESDSRDWRQGTENKVTGAPCANGAV